MVGKSTDSVRPTSAVSPFGKTARASTLSVDAPPRKLLTIDLHVHYFDAAVEEDLIAEGWVRRRGRSTAFVSAEVETASGKTLAAGNMAYRIVP